jgi:hypothetical protein
MFISCPSTILPVSARGCRAVIVTATVRDTNTISSSAPSPALPLALTTSLSFSMTFAMYTAAFTLTFAT